MRRGASDPPRGGYPAKHRERFTSLFPLEEAQNLGFDLARGVDSYLTGGVRLNPARGVEFRPGSRSLTPTRLKDLDFDSSRS